MPELVPMQAYDARLLASWRYGLAASEPGTGKTPVLLRAAQAVAPMGPWFIVTLRNAVLQWHEELRTWAPRTWLAGGKVTVTNWEQLDKPDVRAAGCAAGIVILDELHTCRNMDTVTFKNCLPITRAPGPAGMVKRVWGATGSPVVNGPGDLVAQTVLLGAFQENQAWQLRARYADPQLGGIHGRLDYRGSSNLAELRRLMDSFTIRRRFADYGMQMPPVTFTNWAVTVELGQLGSEYLAASRDFSTWYAATQGREVPPLARFTTLRRLLSMAKVPGVADKIRQELPHGYKILVFTEFRESAEKLHAMFPGSGMMLGGETAGQRVTTVEAARSSPAGHLLFATAGALSAAVNAQMFTRVFYVDMGWSPAGFDQTFKRAWRYLQRAPVSILRFFVEGDELEAFIVGNLLRKTKVLEDLGLEPTGSLRHFGLK